MITPINHFNQNALFFPIQDLPEDLIPVIFSFFPVSTLKATIRVSRKWSDLTQLIINQQVFLKELPHIKNFISFLSEQLNTKGHTHQAEKLKKQPDILMEAIPTELLMEAFQESVINIMKGVYRASHRMHDFFYLYVKEQEPSCLKQLLNLARLYDEIDKQNAEPDSDKKWGNLKSAASQIINLDGYRVNKALAVATTIKDGRWKNLLLMEIFQNIVHKETFFNKALEIARTFPTEFLRSVAFMLISQEMLVKNKADCSLINQVIEEIKTIPNEPDISIFTNIAEVLAKNGKLDVDFFNKLTAAADTIIDDDASGQSIQAIITQQIKDIQEKYK